MSSSIKRQFNKVFEDWSIKTNNNSLFLIKLLIIFLFQVLGFVWKPFILFDLFFVALFLVLDRYENKILYLVFLLPFYNVFRYGTENTQFNQILGNIQNVYFSVWILLIFDICFIIKYIKDLAKKEKKINWSIFIPVLLLYLLLVIPRGNFSNVTSALSGIMVITSLFVSVWLIISYKELLNLKNLANVWLYGILASVFLYCLRGVLPNLNSYLVFLGDRFSGLLRDPNYWSLEVLCLLSLYTVLVLDNKNCIGYSTKFLILSLLGILSMSKAFLITYLIFILLVLYSFYCTQLFKKRSVIEKLCKKRDQNKALIIFFISLIFILLIYLVFQSKIENILYRFNLGGTSANFDDFMDSVTTHRWGIWKNYLSIICSSIFNILFGVGICRGYVASAIHCTPIQLLYFGGISIFVLLAYLIIKYKKQIRMVKFINYIPMITFGIMACSLDLLLSYRTFILITVSILSFTYNSQQQKNNL